jgi:6-phosphogluconate dehydrogenase
MKIAMIGLGKMGSNMTHRLLQAGHQVVVYDLNPEAVQETVRQGATGASSLKNVVDLLDPVRVVWVMVPAGQATSSTIDALQQFLSAGDIILDGGNSYYKTSQAHFTMLKERGIKFIDVGTSGGVWGLTEGYSLMIGGERTAVAQVKPAFEALAPSPEHGWGHVGPSGSGHFVKMVHNGIEYGLMQAYAEGFEILKAKDELMLDLHQVSRIWQHGSVIRSWLLDLTASALAENPEMEGIAAWVPDSGEGRWTVFEAIDLDVPAPVITESLFARFVSRQEGSFAARILASMRNQFGGHAIKPED